MQNSSSYEKIKSDWLCTWRNLHICKEKSFLIKRKSKNSSLQRKRNPLFKKKTNLLYREQISFLWKEKFPFYERRNFLFYMDFKIQGQREISFHGSRIHGSRIMGAPPREAPARAFLKWKRARARFCERNISRELFFFKEAQKNFLLL